MAVSIGSRLALENTITAQKVIQLFDDDGDGLVEDTDEETLDAFIARADAVVVGLLLHKGFTVAQLTLLAVDAQIINAWACICAQLAGERKTEWLDQNGKGPYEAMGQRARADIVAIATGAVRLETETTAGANPVLVGALQTPCPVFVFSPDPTDPYRRGPGGF